MENHTTTTGIPRSLPGTSLAVGRSIFCCGNFRVNLGSEGREEKGRRLTGGTKFLVSYLHHDKTCDRPCLTASHQDYNAHDPKGLMLRTTSATLSLILYMCYAASNTAAQQACVLTPDTTTSALLLWPLPGKCRFAFNLKTKWKRPGSALDPGQSFVVFYAPPVRSGLQQRRRHTDQPQATGETTKMLPSTTPRLPRLSYRRCPRRVPWI